MDDTFQGMSVAIPILIAWRKTIYSGGKKGQHMHGHTHIHAHQRSRDTAVLKNGQEGILEALIMFPFSHRNWEFSFGKLQRNFFAIISSVWCTASFLAKHINNFLSSQAMYYFPHNIYSMLMIYKVSF